MAAKKKATSEVPVSRGKVPSVPPIVEQVLGEGTCSVEMFVECFGVLVDAAGGTPNLRRFVLCLSVRGLLTNEFPCERTQAAISDDGPFATPRSWQWKRLHELAEIGDGPFGSKLKTEHYVPTPGFRVLRLGNIGLGVFRNDDQTYITRKHFESLASCHVKAGDLLVASLGNPPGRSCLVPSDALPAINKADCFRVRISTSRLSTDFLMRVLNSDYAIARATGLHRGDTRGRITLSHLRDTPIPLPPLAEQKCIVARVDQLMALIDEMEAKQTRKREVGAQFTKTSLEALTTAETPEDFDGAWKRVVENWGVVIDRAEKIEEVKKAVVELAIRGRLITSEAGDGAAPEFAEADDEPFPLPAGWRWSHVEKLATHIVDCPHATPKYTASGYPAIRTADVIPGKMLVAKARFVDEAQYQDQIRRLEPRAGDIFYSREGGRLGIAACVPSGVKVCLSQRMMQIRVRQPINPLFVMWAMNSRFVFSQAVGGTGGSASPHVNMATIRRFLVPVPPVPQQKRIVAKVDHLMKLCDELEVKLRRTEARASKLVEAIVQEMVA